MGGYDLYGTYYKNREDAIEAEKAQMAAIDAGIAYRKQKRMEGELSVLQREVADLRKWLKNKERL